jgi:tRNA(fMet)-specific endonuclease VapC
MITNGRSAVGDPAIEPLLRRAAHIAIPVVVLGEYRYGISHSRDRKRYEEWLAEYLPTFRSLSVDEQTTIPYAAVRLELKKRECQFLRMTSGLRRSADSTRFLL